MCGIVGLIAPNPNQPIDEALLWRMLGPIKHRGPDQQRIWSQLGIGLGHARLSIIDLSEQGNQPMTDPQTGHVIVFNGEIYNYLELRQTLKGQGYTFNTESDTEVILKAYQAWGTDCLKQFNGMWALAIWDHQQQRLFCARDRFGVKPFVYALTDQGLAFASESKALISAFPELRSPNPDYTLHFVETGEFAATRDTFYKGIYSLLPGHAMWVSPDKAPPSPWRYWDWQPPAALNYEMKAAEVQETLESLLLDAIKLRFRSDVPVGICLSGGLDSSAITALACEAFGPSFTVFSCIYPNHPEADESAYIKATVDKYGLKWVTTTVEPQDLLALMHQTLVEQDGPTGTASILSQKVVMASAKSEVTVVLGGQGGDEVLGGYHGYFDYSLTSWLRQCLSNPSWQNIQQYWSTAQAIQARTGQKVHKLKTLAHRFKQASRPTHFESHPISPSVLESLTPVAGDDLSTKLLEDLTYKVLPRLLHYEDRNSMGVSLESRLPLLDYRLVEFMFSLPHIHKIKGATTKYSLFKLLEKGQRLPDSVLYRKDKMGFNTPSQRWFQNPGCLKPLRAFIDQPPELLQGLSLEKQRLLKRAWAQCEQGQTISTRSEINLWRYFMTCLWLTQA